MSFLELVAVSKQFGGLEAVSAITLNVATGSRTAIVGPSGSGKTTLLRLIAGFEAPDSGSIRLDGAVLADGAHAVPAYLRGIGIVAQDGALFPHLDVSANIGFGLDRRAPRRAEIIAELNDLVGLGREMLTRKPDQLSGGQQQRVALARALALKPKLMLLDEPFSALDTGLRAATRKVVADLLSAAGITTILVTHDQAEALSFADQVAVLRDGRLEQMGAPREVYFRPRDPMVAELLGEVIMLDAELAAGWATCALGRIRVDDTTRRGPARIMLRPEQIALAAVPACDVPSPEAAFGDITDVDFSGGSCTLTIALLPPQPSPEGAKPKALTLRTSSLALPANGTRVSLTVRETAHVFAG